MLSFNWKELVYTVKDCRSALDLLQCLAGLKVPTKKQENLIKQLKNQDKDITILKYPVLFFLDIGSSNSNKCVYLSLLSKRNPLDISQGVDYLATYYIDDYDIDQLINNRLLKIVDAKIYFKY